MPIASLSACCELATSNDERSLPSWLFSSSGLATRRKRVSKETLGISSWIEIALRRSWVSNGGWWLVVGGWWLVVGGWWLVVGGWWLVVGGW